MTSANSRLILLRKSLQTTGQIQILGWSSRKHSSLSSDLKFRFLTNQIAQLSDLSQT